MRCSDAPRSQRRLHRRRASFAAGMLLSFAVHAEDLGVIGPVYPIAEPSLLEVILARLREAEADGSLAQLQRAAQTRARRSIEAPTPVATVTRTTRPRSFYYDPSIVVADAITDAAGSVIVPPGTTINPLDTVALSQPLLFIDARDATQIARAADILEARQGRVKVILTGGSYLALMQRWHRPVFFDQQGLLTTKLAIRQVPALVSQEGRRLRIDELR